MRQLMPDLRNSGTVLLLASLALSVATLTGMLSVGEPARQEAVMLLPRRGMDTFYIFRVHGESESRFWPISQAQIAAIRRLDLVIVASRWRQSHHYAKHGRHHRDVIVTGTDEYRDSVSDMALSEPCWDTLVAGRGILGSDVANRGRVCVLPTFFAEELRVADLGTTIRIDGHPFEVIGFRGEGIVRIPSTTYSLLFGEEFALTVLTRGERAQVEDRLESHLQQIFGTDDHFLLKYSHRDSALGYHAQAVRKLLTFGLIGAVPLVVSFCGALGIALVWVRERMWNYALLRALGATRLQVGLGAIVEPFVIASCAAAAGLVCGWLLCSFLQVVTGLEVAYNWRWFAAAWAAGLAAMVLPATYVSFRAAFVPPAEALRM